MVAVYILVIPLLRTRLPAQRSRLPLLPVFLVRANEVVHTVALLHKTTHIM